jgi:hypothetical protein
MPRPLADNITPQFAFVAIVHHFLKCNRNLVAYNIGLLARLAATIGTSPTRYSP